MDVLWATSDAGKCQRLFSQLKGTVSRTLSFTVDFWMHACKQQAELLWWVLLLQVHVTYSLFCLKKYSAILANFLQLSQICDMGGVISVYQSQQHLRVLGGKTWALAPVFVASGSWFNQCYWEASCLPVGGIYPLTQPFRQISYGSTVSERWALRTSCQSVKIMEFTD